MGGWFIGFVSCDQQKARPPCGEPFSSRHPESASSARGRSSRPRASFPPLHESSSEAQSAENGEGPHCIARAIGGSPSEGWCFPVPSEAIHNTPPPSVDLIH